MDLRSTLQIYGPGGIQSVNLVHLSFFGTVKFKYFICEIYFN